MSDPCLSVSQLGKGFVASYHMTDPHAQLPHQMLRHQRTVAGRWLTLDTEQGDDARLRPQFGQELPAVEAVQPLAGR